MPDSQTARVRVGGFGFEEEAAALRRLTVSARAPHLTLPRPPLISSGGDGDDDGNLLRGCSPRSRGGLAEWNLLEALLEELPDAFEEHVLTTLDPTDHALRARVNKKLGVAVTGSRLPRTGTSVETSLELIDFVDTVPRIAWARANNWHLFDSCIFSESYADPCALAAKGVNLEVIQYG